MLTSSEEKVKTSFVARENELNQLIHDFKRTSNNEMKFALIEGDSGLGKTRLIQELYYYLTTHQDPDDFWPSNLQDTIHTMTITPSLDAFEHKDNVSIPWYWFGIRCENREERNSGQLISSLNQIRNQVLHQFNAIIEQQKKTHRNKSALKSSLTLIANYALPGSVAAFDIVDSIVSSIDTGVSTIGSVKDLFSIAKNKKLKDPRHAVDTQEYQSLVTQTIDLMETLFHKTDGESTPLVLVIDDAQWIDSLTFDFIEKLLEKGQSEAWPIFIISTCWESSLKEQCLALEEGDTKSFGRLYENILKEKYESSLTKIELQPIPHDSMSTLITQSLPNLSVDVHGVIIEQCSGDLELLYLLIDRITKMPGYLTKDGNLKVSPEKLKFKQHKKKELFRERILSLGTDTSTLLAIGSAQGFKFSRQFIEFCATHFELDTEESILDQFISFDNPYNITQNKTSMLLDEIAEFKRHVYYEVSREILDDSAFEDEMNPLLLHYYQHTYTQLESTREEALTMNTEELLVFIEEYINLLIGTDGLTVVQSDHLEKLAIRLLKNYLSSGLFEACILRGDSLLSIEINDTLKSDIVKILLEASFLLGLVEKETDYLTILESLQENKELVDPEYHYYQSHYLLRHANLDEAQEHAEKARLNSSLHEDELVRFLCAELLIKVYFYKGNYSEGSKLISTVQEEFLDLLTESPKLNAHFHHNISLFSHNFDKNELVTIHSQQAKEMYDSLDDQYNYYLSCVNLADGLMGMGDLENAEKEIAAVYELTLNGNYRHAHNIAALCYGNILTVQGRLSEAFVYFEKGIQLSNDINHDWDSFYGRAWRLYALAKFGDPTAYRQLSSLQKEAEKTGYAYIVSLITVIRRVVARQFNLETDRSELRDINVKETPGLYALAAVIESLNGKQVIGNDDIADLLVACEGMKLGHEYIVEFRNANVGTLNDEKLRSLDEWLVKYVHPVFRCREEIESQLINKGEPQVKISSCGLSCEAMCCYDGVYISEREEKIITEVVANNRDLFPDNEEYIIDGNWNNLISGRKAATVHHAYQNNAYPAHFTQTRCIFANDEGLCNLQVVATNEEKHPWKYKPEACWMHPLQIENNQIVGPPTNQSVDQDFIDATYPGYISYTKCGQACSEGDLWQRKLKQEILYANFLNSSEQ